MVARETVEGTRWSLYGDVTANDQRNIARYSAWLGGWLVLWIAARLAMEGWPTARHGFFAWWLVAITLLPAVATLRAYMRFVREADELLRKIQLEALALAFGAGAMFMMAWRLVEKAGGPELNVNDPLLVMLAVWVGAQWWGARRYR